MILRPDASARRASARHASAHPVARPACAHPVARRAVLALLAGAAALPLAPRPAAALSAGQAESFVKEVIAEVTALLESGGAAQAQMAGFRRLFARRAATPQIVRFVMGVAWRDMSAPQQAAMQDAFLDYVARVYGDLLQEYKGQTIEVRKVQDFGRKGVLVISVAKGQGVEDVAVEWLVSDRAGNGPQLIDVTIEGLSMLQSQRQEFAAMLERRGGDVDRLIADLKSGNLAG